MRICSILIVFLSLWSYGQDTIFYNKLIANKIGESVPIKFKSQVTGGKMTSYLSDGKWLAVDSVGNTLVEANYVANKRKKSTTKDGLEIYIEPQSGDTILIRDFNKGKLVNQLAYKNAILVAGNTVFHCYRDFESYSVAEYRYSNSGRPDFTSIWKSSIEDPSNILEDTGYLALEQKIGDPSLLQPASFSTKARYNFVNNPEFEVHPTAFFSIMSFKDQVYKWKEASESPDFYLSDGGALSGRSFVGFRVFSMQKHIEYLQNELKEPLEAGRMYCFSAFLKLSPGSKYATNAFGFLLVDNAQKINTDELLTITPSKRLDNQILNYKTQWMKVQCTYKAKGGERFLVLGSFQNHQDLELVEVPGRVNECYYYLDDVSLVPIAREEDCDCNFRDERDTTQKQKLREEKTGFSKLKPGDKLVLDNLHFNNDESELLPESFRTLGEVLAYLNTNKHVVVEISGHTSSLGGLEHNVKLSQRRALAVKEFLTLNGVNGERISTVGHGPKYPIASDDTEVGQKENRRVEFKLLSL
jgi:outer membrane protein OmpA-like peptidoglycan-associated protein